MQLAEASCRELVGLEAVRALEAMLLQHEQLQLETETLTHGQVSARAVFIPAGTVLTGAETNLDNVCIVLGDITVTTGDGPPRRITGFGMLAADRGAKRAGFAHADTWWVTVHHTTLTRPRDIEDEMTGEAGMLQSRRGA
jgi:hypothetical protein